MRIYMQKWHEENGARYAPGHFYEVPDAMAAVLLQSGAASEQEPAAAVANGTMHPASSTPAGEPNGVMHPTTNRFTGRMHGAPAPAAAVPEQPQEAAPVPETQDYASET